MATPVRASLALLGILAGGCASSGSNPSAGQTPRAESPDLPPEIAASKVTNRIYGPAPARTLYYEIKSDTAEANLGGGQLESAVLKNVSGTIYTKGPCTFEALSARASRSMPKVPDLNILVLTGSVHVHCLKPAGNLYCDQLTVNMKTHIVKALGHVRFDTASGIQGTMPEAWATQDLMFIASPLIFQEGVKG